ncbi:MAG: diaminopimelate decarboxylase family protein, partial [Sarcina sp.]
MNLFGTMKVKENSLEVGGVKYSELAEEFATPLYVLDEELIRDNCKKFKKAFSNDNFKTEVIYAGKAFLNLSMCKIIYDEGLSLDVVSGGELYTAYKSSFPMDKIYFHGNNKTLEEINMGVKLDVGIFVVDNIFEAERLNEISRRYNKVQNIYIRICPGIEAHTHDYIKTGALDSKFGFPFIEDNIVKVVEKIKIMKNIKLCGLHCHIGSQIFDTIPYKDEAKIMVELLKEVYDKTGIKIQELNLGGGFGIYYSENDKPKKIEEYCEAIINSVDKVSKKLKFKLSKVCIEPGRSII